MTIEEAKELLQSYKIAEERYNSSRAILEELETYAFRTGGGGSVRVKSTPDVDKMSNIVERISTAKDETRQRAMEAIKAMRAVVVAIDKVENPALHKLLIERYIHGQDFDTIAQGMGYSWRWTMKMHIRAIEEVAEKN